MHLICRQIHLMREARGFSTFYPLQQQLFAICIKSIFAGRFERATLLGCYQQLEAILESEGFAENVDLVTEYDRRLLADRTKDPLGLWKRVTHVVTERQYGKSFCMQLLAAAAMVTFRRFNVLITSNRKDLSETNRSYIVQLLIDTGHPMLVVNTSTVTMRRTRSRLSVRSESGVRGNDGEYVIVDEAAFVRPELYTRQIGPIIRKHKCTGNFFTTPKEDSLLWASLTEEPTHGDIRLLYLPGICRDCRAENRNDCSCFAYLAPEARFDQDTMRLISHFYKFDPAAFKEEIQGVTLKRDATLLNPETVTAFIEKRLPWNHSTARPMNKHIYVSYDPTGSNVSCTAFVTAYYDEALGKMVVFGIDNIKFEMDILKGVALVVRQLVQTLASFFPGCTLVTVLECVANLDHIQYVAGLFDQVGLEVGMAVDHVRHKREERMVPGASVNASTQVASFFWLSTLLSKSSIVLAEPLCCVAGMVLQQCVAPSYLADINVELLCSQMQKKHLVRRSKHVTLSDKDENDDILMALLNAIHVLFNTHRDVTVHWNRVQQARELDE